MTDWSKLHGMCARLQPISSTVFRMSSFSSISVFPRVSYKFWGL